MRRVATGESGFAVKHRTGARVGGGRQGFVLGVVVFLLFAIAVAGAAGFQLVSTVFASAQGARDGEAALVTARAGLSRFMGEQIGEMADSVTYAVGRGVAVVRARRIVERDSLNHLYFIRSEGTITDGRSSGEPARRVVGTYAWHRISPIPHLGAVIMTGGDFDVELNGDVYGFDHATTADCPGGGTSGTYGVATGGTTQESSGGDRRGNPSDEDESYTGFDDIYGRLNIRWDILSNPAFPMQFDGTAPNWSSIPSDSFPRVRYVGNLSPDDGTIWDGGRGVLIVTGYFRPGYYFNWDGIILAGHFVGTPDWYHATIRGMFVGGLNGGQTNQDLESGDILYHSCNVYAANRALSYLQEVDGARFELD